jgi:MSHA biogenesis protein MshQ
MILKKNRQHFKKLNVLVAFFIFMLLFFSVQSHAAVTYLNKSEANSGTGNLTSGTPLTSTHPATSGTDRLLLVAISFRNNRYHEGDSVTYGGTALTRVVTNIRANNSARVEIWRLVQADAPAGLFDSAQTISVLFNNTYAAASAVIGANTTINQGVGFGALTFSGVNQKLPYHNITTSNIIEGPSTTPSLSINLTDGDLAFAVVAQRNQTGAFTAPTGDQKTTFIARTSAGATAIKQSSASSFSLGWTSTVSDNWTMAGLAIKPALGVTSCITFRDDFSSRAYNLNTGDTTFTGNWTETGEANSATNGFIQIPNPAGELRFRGVNPQNRTIERNLNLNPGSYDSATLTFKYRTGADDWINTDSMQVAVTGSSTTNTTAFPRDHVATATNVIDITNQMSTTTNIKLSSTAIYGTNFSYIDFIQVKACTEPVKILSTTTSCTGKNKVTVKFSKTVDPGPAGTLTNYALSGPGFPPATITSASVVGDSVTLTTSADLAAGSYTLTVNNITASGTTIAPGTTSTFSPPTNCGGIVAYYPFDESLLADSIVDKRTPPPALTTPAVVGDKTMPVPAGKFCNARYFPYNDNATDQYAIDTGIDVDTLGAKGSISFWYKNDVAWLGNGNRTLFDASTNGNNRFYLALLDTGRLRLQLRVNGETNFAVSPLASVTENFTRTDWVHIAATWDLANTGSTSTIKLYVNGTATTNTATDFNTAFIASNNPFDTLYFGDNRAGALAAASNSAGGRIDEVYIYSTVRADTDILNEANNTTPPNGTCSTVCSYRDDFTTNASYSTSDGSADWLTNWQSDSSVGVPPPVLVAPDPNFVFVDGGAITARGNDGTTPPVQRDPNKSNVERQFSLDGVTGDVTLFYTYTLPATLEAVDNATIVVSNGSAEVPIETINATAGVAETKTTKFVLTEAALTRNANMKISIKIPNGTGNCCFEDDLEFISFQYISIYAAGICSVNPLNYIQIQHDGNGLTCEPEKIYLKACATSDLPCTTTSPVPVTVNVETSTAIGGPYSVLSSQNILTGTTVEVPISQTTVGSLFVRTTVTSTPAASSTPSYKCYNATSTCEIKFSNSGFVIDLPTQPLTCGTPTTPADITIRAVVDDPTSPIDGNSSCSTYLINDKNINFTVTDQAGTPPFPSNIVMKQSGLTKATFTTSPTTTAATLNFINGAATFNLDSDNVAYINLAANFVDGSLTFNGEKLITYRPKKFVITAKDNTGTTALTNNAATGTPTWKASDNFQLTLQAQCSDDTVATNYVPSNALMKVELQLPGSGVLNRPFTIEAMDYTIQALGDVAWPHNISTKFINGEVKNASLAYANAAFHDVGVVKLSVKDDNYLSGNIAEQSLTIGRFRPHHFDTTVTHGCSGFTYSGQPFRVQATAMNNQTAPVATQNYAGNFAQDTTISNIGNVTNFANNTIAASLFMTGVAQTADPATLLGSTAITYTFPIKETLPYTLPLSARDVDTQTEFGSGVPVTGATNATTPVRSGRISLNNVFGPVTTPLTMKLTTEYYDTDGFIISDTDTCTKYNVDTANSIGSFGNYVPPEIDSPLSYGSPTLNALGTGTVVLGEGSFIITPPIDAAGKVNFLLSSNAPGDTDYPNNPSWLTYPWGVNCLDNSLTGSTLTAACASAIFGLYRGDDRIIYWREIF